MSAGACFIGSPRRSEMLIPAGRKLPERFTLEIDVLGPPSGVNEMVSVEGGAQMDRGATSGNLLWNPHLTWIEGNQRVEVKQ